MFKDILLPIDLEEDDGTARKALNAAVEYCRDHGAGLHVLTVVPGFGMSIISQYFPEDAEQKILNDAAERLRAFIAAHVPRDITAQAIVASGTVYEEILETARKIGCDLIVMCAHRPDLKDYLLGPNAARVVRHADCSVLVVRE
ncbi:MAG: universal stress protein [Alphaproteobacteria bacterium]|nr:MAG: universal stress protein [Alphaproteobacteria bacterium]